MKTWKITIEYKGQIIEVIMQAPFYSDAYVNAEMQYPGCTIKSILEMREKN